MNAPLPEHLRRALETVTLDDKYALAQGRAFMSGVQALVRLPMLQQQRDAAAGLHTAGFISGSGTFELQVVTRDLDSFAQFARNVLLNLPNVKDVHTSFSLGEIKASAALPLEHLLRQGTGNGYVR